MLKLSFRLASLSLLGSLLSFVPVPEPQQGLEPYERVPGIGNGSTSAIFPRWMTFTQVDAIMGAPPIEFPANENPVFLYTNRGMMGVSSVAVDSRGVAHVVQRTNAPAGVAYYNSRFDTRQTNGFSERVMLFTDTDSRFAVGNPDIWVDHADVVHVVFTVAELGPNQLLAKSDIVYRSFGTSGWMPALGGDPTFLTEARYQYNPPPGQTFSDFYSATQILTDANDVVHIFGIFGTNFPEGPEPGYRHLRVNPITIDEFNDLRPERIALGANNGILITGQQVTVTRLGQNPSQGLGYATWSVDSLGPISSFGQTGDANPDIAVDSANMPHLVFERQLQGVPQGQPNYEIIYYNSGNYTTITQTDVPYKRIGVDSRDQVHLVYMSPVPIYPDIQTSEMVSHMCYAARMRNPNPNQVNTEWRKQEPIGATCAEYARGRPPGPAPFPGEITHGPPSEIAISANDVIHVVDEFANYTRMIEYGLGARDSLAMVPALPNGSVDVTSGNLLFNLGLFSTRGVSPTQAVNLVYNSMESTGGPIAPGWKLNYEVYLVDHWRALNNPSGSYTDQPQESITVFMPDGRPVHFRYRSFSEGSVNACYLVPNDDFGLFVKLERSAWNTINPEYELTFKSGDVWTFNDSGKVREMRDSTGNCICFTYNNGILSGIFDQTISGGGGGRATSLATNEGNTRHCPRIETIVDAASGTYTLGYSGNKLDSVAFSSGPSSPTWSFAYHTANNSAQLNRVNLLSEVRTPRGHVEGYHYDCRYLQDNRIAEVEDPTEYVLRGSTGDGGAAQFESPKLELRYITPPMPQTPSDTWVTCKRRSNSGGAIQLRYVHDARRGLIQEFHDPYSQAVGYLQRGFNEYGLLTDQTDRYGCVTQYWYLNPDPLTPHVRDNLMLVQKSSGSGAGMDTVGTYTWFIDEDFTRVQSSAVQTRSASESTPQPRGTTYQYDGSGRLTILIHPSVNLPDGSQQNSTTGFTCQGPRGALSRITNENGNSQHFSSFHAVHGLPQSITRDGGSQAESLTYDNLGNQLTHTAPAGGVFNESPGASIVLLDGIYRVYTSIDPSGRSTTYEYDLDSNRTTVQPPAGGSSITAFDKRGFATGGSTPDGSWSQWVNEDGQVERTSDFRGYVTNHDYDDLGRLTATRSPGGTTGGGGGGPDTHTTQYVHDIMAGSNHVMTMTQVGSPGRTTSITYDRRGRAISTMHPDNATRTDSMYNEADELVATHTFDGNTLLRAQINFTDHRGRNYGSRIQGIGFQFGMSAPLDSRTTWSFLNGAGAVVQQVGPRGNVSSPTDPLDRTVYVRDQRDRVTEIRQGFEGVLTTVQENVYGDDNQVTETRMPDPVNPLGSMVTHRKYAYTTRKELKSSLNANNQGMTYVYSTLPGQVDTGTDAGGTVTKTTYHSWTQRVDEVIEGFGTGNESRTKSIWDYGFLTETQVYNPSSGGFNASITRVFDRAGRLERLQAPQVQPEVLSYNDYGEVATHFSGSATATHTYNAMGRQTDTDWSGAYNDGVARGFDAQGNLTLMDDGSFRKEWVYDPVTGLPETERFYIGVTPWKTHTYEYDESGNLTELTDGEMNVHAWVYDDANRVVGIRYAGIEVCSLAYTKGGLLAITTLRNSSGATIARTTYTYDSKGRRERAYTIRTGSGAVLSDLRWEYDTRDRVTKVKYHHLGVETSVGYNFRGEVTSESTNGNGGGQSPLPYENQFGDAPTGNEASPTEEVEATPGALLSIPSRSASYTYDRGGNRISQTIDGVSTTLSYDSGNRLTSESRSGYSVTHLYDTWGNETGRTTSEGGDTTVETFGYNYLNRMSSYTRTVNSVLTANWQYDFWPSGERAGKTNLANNNGEMYATFGNNVVTDYTTSPGNNIHANTYAQGLGLDQKTLRIPVSGGRIHYLGDMVGTVTMTLTDGAMKSEECLRDVWGNTLAGDTDNERYGFAQREHDMESGLVYMRHRMYDPRIGRFTQTDPLVWNRPFSHYTYADNNPVSGRDPTGLITDGEVNQYRGLMRRYLNQYRQAIENGDLGGIQANLRRYQETASVLTYELRIDQALASNDHLLAGMYRNILAGKKGDAATAGVDLSVIKADPNEALIDGIQKQRAVMALGAKLEGVESEALVMLMTLPLEVILARVGARGVGREILGFADDFARMATKARKTLKTGARTLADGDYDGAEAAYKAIRAADGDIASIAKNTGIREDRIRRIKDHLFNATHQLDDGVRRFDADPAIANAWRRLQQGSHVQGDVNLLMHELFESRFEGIFKSTYRAAHEAAERAGRPGLPR